MPPRVSRTIHTIAPLFTVFIWLCVIVYPLGAAEHAPNKPDRIQGQKVALVIPYGRYNRYLHEELMSAFTAQGVNVSIVSSQVGMATPNQGKIPLAVKTTLDQVDMAKFDALVFSGGGSLYNEFANKPKTTALIQQAVKLDKVVAGLDLGKAVLVNAGIIDYQIPKDKDAIGAAVTVSGRVVTGNSQYVVEPFIAALLEVMNQDAK